MNCLNNADIQSVADREATEDARRHAASCARCAERVRERELLTSSLLDALDQQIDMPAHLTHRIGAALAAGHASGATRLRGDVSTPPRRRAYWSAAIAAAATLVAVVFVAPMLKGPATVSASEILAASASRLQARVTGIEEREYELIVDGVSKDIMPDHANGTYRVWQAIDHDTPGRFRFASFGPDGQPISSIAQDPVQRRRVTMMTIEGQAYRFETSLPELPSLSLPELERLHMEATITMMRASGNQLLQIVDTPEGQQYRIEVQHATDAAANPVWDIAHARIVVNERDYRIVEFAVTGTFLKQPYSVSYKMIRQTLGAALPPEAFEVPGRAGQIELSGEGSAVPVRDAMILALRELTRLKQVR